MNPKIEIYWLTDFELYAECKGFRALWIKDNGTCRIWGQNKPCRYEAAKKDFLAWVISEALK